MPNFVDLLVFFGMVALRFGVPALVLAGLVYGLKRLDRRWEAEAHDYAAKHPEARPAVQPTTPRPAAPVRMPAPAKEPVAPFIIPPAIKDQRIQPGLSAAMPAAPASSTSTAPGASAASAASAACWDVKGCSPATKSQCAAAQHPDQPCWQARFDAEGQIPEDCVKCDVFQRYPMV